MAHHPSKFVSVNLNKSYGRPSLSSSSSAAANGRPRAGSHSGGGLVVLSRPRSSSSSSSSLQKPAGPKLSVPPPLNLPSLRKESEKFDAGSAPGSAARPGSSGVGSVPGASTMRWTKPTAAVGGPDAALGKVGDRTYLPAGARLGGQAVAVSVSSPVTMVEKAVVLRGEDFPSLRATVSLSPKPKDSLKQKGKVGEDGSEGRLEKLELPQSPLHMRPQMRSSRVANSVGDGDGGGLGRQFGGGRESSGKQDGYFPGPLPVVRLVHTSNWADDERDTGLSLPERDRDRGFSRMESGRVHDVSDGRGSSFRDDDEGSVPSKDFFRGDSFGRGNLVGPGKDGRDMSSWRAPPPPQQREGFGHREVGSDRDRGRVMPFGGSREMNKEISFGHSPYGDSARDGLGNGMQDSRYVKKDWGYTTNIQNGKNVAETYSGRGNEQNMRGRYGEVSNNRYRGDAFQSSTITKSPFSSGSKGLPLNDPILNFGKEKWLGLNSGKPYLGDAGFDSSDPFADDHIGEVNVKVLKKKKEMLKQTDFHDPVRESFEAELERVQRIQEQERQRAMEEQLRALEIARREQEERERLVREEEERRRLIEEEAKEAAWRAEQEKMEAARRAEEQRIAREEEKRRIIMEEERRKEAARQKLMELEARMARRQTEAKVEERLPGSANEKEIPKVTDVGDWVDGERMVEQITSTALSDSSMNRFLDTGSRPNSSVDGNSPFRERGKHANYWKKDTYDNGTGSMFHLQDQESDYRSSRRDTVNSGRGFPRREVYGGLGAASLRPSSKGGSSESSQFTDDFRQLRGNRWNVAGDSDHFSRNIDVDAEFMDNDKFGDGVWGSGRSRGSPHSPYSDRLYQNSDVDGFSSFGRSRHSLRQPRVLPPPSVTSMRQSTSRALNERPSSSSFMDTQMRYQHAIRSEEEIMQTGYDDGYQENVRQSGTTELLEGNAICSDQKEEKDSPRCDSQSSLSVSSPPSSPTHLSHDDLDEAESSTLQTSAAEEQTILEVGNATLATSASGSNGEDDEWAIDNNEEMQEQEVYDEEDDGYQEEEEAHDLGKEFEDLQSAAPITTGEVDQLVLGFDEGVEVSIPVDDFEKVSGNGDEAIGQRDSVGAVQEHKSNGDHSFQAETAFTEGTLSDSYKIISETENALQELVLEEAAVSTTSYTAGTVEATNNSAVPAQQPISSPLSSSMPSSSLVQPISTSVSTADTHAEAPVRLQFGLFSGPSLIPSPVPAIQIGSIQMPLHLHPQMHPSQPPIFQFGQLRYTSPISQGILPLAPQTMSYIRPPAPAHYPSNQNFGGSLYGQACNDSSSQNNQGITVPSRPLEEHPGLVTKPIGPSQEKANLQQPNELSDPTKSQAVSEGPIGSASLSEDRSRHILVSHDQRRGIRNANMKRNYRLVTNNRESQLHPGNISSQLLLGEKAQNGSRAPGIISGNRGKRFAYNVRNTGTRPPFPLPETSRTNSSGFQRRPRRSIRRTEFRVRENVDRRQMETPESFSNPGQDGKSNFGGRSSGTSSRYGVRKDAVSSKSMKIEPENLNFGTSSSQALSSHGKIDKPLGKDALSKKRVSSTEHSKAGEVNLRRNGSSEEDVDAPLQSGVVCVFKQPGIEAPSDEDDFIEVRSKRQMLNDRREQREKEIKAKSKVIKAPRKHRVVPQSNAVVSGAKKTVTSSGGDASKNGRSEPIITDGRGFASIETSPILPAHLTSQTLPPIGTPAVKADLDTRSNNLKSSQTSSASVTSNGGTKFVPGLSFENKNTGLVSTSLPLGSWGSPDINQQVMALTQSQLDDAMKPVRFESHVASSISLEPTKQATSEKPFSSSASPLNSLLAGEKIQFGAVTSPTILPPVSRAVSSGIGAPGSCRTDVSKEHNLTATSNECSIFFDKGKHPDESSAHLEDPESEAEAAASAVAVAAISSNDEIVANRLGACSIPDNKNFCGADSTGLTSGGVTASQEITGQSAAEESLTVALPADLSVDTPALPLWPPLPSPQSTSGPMLSHFPGGPPHFPCFEMNPMLGGPIFAFGPHDESAGTQAQPQRSTTVNSGPLGAWPHVHSGMDSFYGPPAGFTGPFISPPGGIPGVQAPPHMVVYNHFAPVGQFGQVGLSYMGTTYIPTGKQPDWKHNPVSSAVGATESDLSSMNVVSGQRNPSSMPSPIQHLAPGSPLMPMASPLAMFDISPFQTSADIPYQARWSHVAAPPPIHSVPLTVPLQQQHRVESGIPPQFCRGLPVDTSNGNNRFNEPRSSAPGEGNRSLSPGEGNRSFSMPNDSAPQFPAELGLVEPPTVSTASSQTTRPSYSGANANNSKGPNSSKGPSRNILSNSASESGGITTNSSNNVGQNVGQSYKSQAAQHPSSSGQQYLHPIGFDQRGAAASQKTGTGGEWHRRMGYQGRSQSSGSDKSFAPSSKMKQIYVAKPPSSGPANTS